jgi:hypothetical protein
LVFTKDSQGPIVPVHLIYGLTQQSSEKVPIVQAPLNNEKREIDTNEVADTPSTDVLGLQFHVSSIDKAPNDTIFGITRQLMLLK